MTDLAVIMSVYTKDRLGFVRESVESILNQTFGDFHYYIAFDGPVSPDIENYVTSIKDARIRLHRFDCNRGLAAVLNSLLAIILKNNDYRFIARMDADDISSPGRFQKQYDHLNADASIDIVGTWYEEIDESGKTISLRKLPVKHANLMKRFYISNPFAHSSVMFRRRLIEIAGFYPENTFLMEDYALWCSAMSRNLVFENIPEYLHKFRVDRTFYQKRSGFLYGWKYIKTKFSFNRKLSLPLKSYILSILLGMIRMMPPVLLKLAYFLRRKFIQ